MANEIFSIKMYELDQKIGRLRSRIEIIESSDHDRIRSEISGLRGECAENRAELVSRMKYSKNRRVAVLSESYEEMEQMIKNAMDKLEHGGENEAFSADERILLAEYTLDFAMQAVNHALLVSMEALDAYMSQEEKL